MRPSSCRMKRKALHCRSGVSVRDCSAMLTRYFTAGVQASHRRPLQETRLLCNYSHDLLSNMSTRVRYLYSFTSTNSINSMFYAWSCIHSIKRQNYKNGTINYSSLTNLFFSCSCFTTHQLYYFQKSCTNWIVLQRFSFPLNFPPYYHITTTNFKCILLGLTNTTHCKIVNMIQTFHN